MIMFAILRGSISRAISPVLIPTVESVHIPALERDFALDVFSRLHVLEMKPEFVETTKGRSEHEISPMARFMLSLPDMPAADYIDARMRRSIDEIRNR